MCLSEERPIEDEDPAETARLKEVLLDLTDGKADTTALTPEARSRLSPERLQQVSAFYRSLGLVQFLQFLEVRPSLRDWGIG
jgi:hypothetical protein